MICPDCNGKGEAIYYEYLGTDFAKNTVNIKPKKDICRTCNGSGHMTQTNADRIRAMSDEELAQFLNTRGCPSENHSNCFEMSCKHCWEKWLKQPAEV